MQSHNNCEADKEYIFAGKKRSEYKGIQAWCADMWALLWNAWHLGFSVKIHSEMDFCWANGDIQEWQNKKILHYTGSIDKENKQYFRKTNYVKYTPYYDVSLRKIRQNSCSFPLVQLINNYRTTLDDDRIDLQDITFLIPVRIDSESRLQNLYYTTQYLNKYFKTNIIIIEADKQQKIDIELLPRSCHYNFLYDESFLLAHTKINNLLIKKAVTKFIAIQDTDAIIPVTQIAKAINLLRENKYDMVYAYDGLFVSVDSLTKEMFGKLLDTDLFLLNEDKFLTSVKRSYGGSVFVHRETYINAGMDNEFFESWGPEDIERQKRMKNLGYKVARVEGPLFHLSHERFSNSAYYNSKSRVVYMEEYLKVCNMNKTVLEAYIQTWPWVNKNVAYANN